MLTTVCPWYKPAITDSGYSNLMEPSTVNVFSVKRQYTVLVLSPHVHFAVRFISAVSNGEFCFNLLNSELNPICHLLGLLGAHSILHISRIRVKFNIILWLRSISLPSARPALHKSLFSLSNNEEPEVGCRMVGCKADLPSQATIAYCYFNSRHKVRRTSIFLVFTVCFMLLLRKFTAVPLRCGVTSRFTAFCNSTQA